MFYRILSKIYGNSTPRAVHKARVNADRLESAAALLALMAISAGFGYMVALWIAGETSILP